MQISALDLHVCSVVGFMQDTMACEKKKKKRIHRKHVYSSPRARPHTRLAGLTTPRLACGTNSTYAVGRHADNHAAIAMQISGAPKHPTPEQLKTAQPQGERRPTWTLTAGFAYDLVRVAGGGASTALHRGGSRFHLVRRESCRPGRLTAHLTQGSLCLGVGATLREDTPILSPDARPHRPRCI